MMKQEFEWIKCEERLPENPKSPLHMEMYMIARIPKKTGTVLYGMCYWADGWNCSLNFDGTFDRSHEIKDIVAWAEIPKYEG